MTDPSATWTQPSLGTAVPTVWRVGGGSGWDVVPPPQPASAAQAIIQRIGFRITAILSCDADSGMHGDRGALGEEGRGGSARQRGQELGPVERGHVAIEAGR